MKARYLLTLLLSAAVVAAVGATVYQFAPFLAPGPSGESDTGEDQNRPMEDTDPNVPPTARFSWQPENPRVGERITFDASDSRDPDGDVSLFRWSFGSHDAVEGRGPLAFRTFADAGIEHVKLTVFDESGATDSHDEDVTVRSVIPHQTLHHSYWGYWGEADILLIRNETRWTKVWGLATGGSSSPPALPEVDFSAETVVLMGIGHRSTAGYDVSIEEVLFDGTGVEVVANVTYGTGCFFCPAVTYPVHVVKIEGVWSDANLLLRHHLFNSGEVVFKTEKDWYSIGEVVRFSVGNDLIDLSINLTPKHPWFVFRDLGTEWRMIWFQPSSSVNVTIEPGDSVSWGWSSGPKEGSLTAGLYRLELYLRLESYRGIRLITFFTLT